MKHTVANSHKGAKFMLILDDDPDMTEYFSSVAELCGLRSAAINNPEHLLVSLDDDVDYILLDIFMPGMDGVQVIRELGLRGCRAHLILVSGIDETVLESADKLARKQGLQVLGHLTKPVRLQDFEVLFAKDMEGSRFVKASDEGIPSGPVLTRRDLQVALVSDQIYLVYQPQYSIAEGKMVGMEALARWNSPHHGEIQPAHFVKCYETYFMADKLTWAVLEKCLTLMRDNVSIAGQHVAINISVDSLMDLSMPDRLMMELERFGIAPCNLVLEVTESRLLDDLTVTMDTLIRLRMKGFQLSIDDFGTGYAMMNQLRHIPADEIKIDRSFISDALNDRHARIVVEKTIEIGHELNMRVVAEGVETQAQLDFLRECGCDIAQGYLLGKPVEIK